MERGAPGKASIFLSFSSIESASAVYNIHSVVIQTGVCHDAQCE